MFLRRPDALSSRRLPRDADTVFTKVSTLGGRAARDRPVVGGWRDTLLFHELQVAGAFRIELQPHRDARGFFARAYSRPEFAEHGIHTDYPQTNISLNLRRGTLRGIHYRADGDEPKLVRCIAGSLYDVIVDLRPESPTFLTWAGVELSRANREMVSIPAGCGHGYQTLEDDTEILYQMGAMYAPAQDRGARWDDPAFGIEWPLPPEGLSERDRSFPPFVSSINPVDRRP